MAEERGLSHYLVNVVTKDTLLPWHFASPSRAFVWRCQVKKPALVIMVKQPVTGQVKTRLQPRLTPQQSADLATAFLLDSVDLALSSPSYTPFLAFTPLKAKTFFQNLIPDINLIPQTGKNLGRRMNEIINKLVSLEYSPIVIIGSDIPSLQTSVLEQALVSLKTCDLCLGPTSDGGYYLVGVRKPVSSIFEGIPWGTDQVLDATLKKATNALFSISLLDVYSDVDTFADLTKLTMSLRVPTHTETWLKTIFSKINYF